MKKRIGFLNEFYKESHLKTELILYSVKGSKVFIKQKIIPQKQ